MGDEARRGTPVLRGDGLQGSEVAFSGSLNGKRTPNGNESKKRRPSSPEVVVHARPRTPSNTASSGIEQEQSPTKKLRTETTTRIYKESAATSSSIFTAWHAETNTSKATSTTGLHVDVGLASATENLANFTTLTPGASSQVADRKEQQQRQHARTASTSSRPASRPSSPTHKSRTTPVVEIYQSRPGTAGSQRSSPTRIEDKGKGVARGASPELSLSTSSSDSEALLLPASNTRHGLVDRSHTLIPGQAPEGVSLAKTIAPETSQGSAHLASSNSSSLAMSSGSAKSSPDLPPSSQFPLIDFSTSEEITLGKPRASTSASTSELPPSSMFTSSLGSLLVPARKAAAKKTSYVDASSSADEATDDLDLVLPANNKPSKTRTMKSGSRKGKARSTESEETSLSELETQVKGSGRKKANVGSSSKLFPSSASKGRQALPKSRSEGNLGGGRGKKGRRKGGGGGSASDSSDLEDLFGTSVVSPSKRKAASTRAKGTPSNKPAKNGRGSAKSPSLITRPMLSSSSDDDLPTLPFSSQPPPNSQPSKSFDLLDIDNDVFVAIPARRNIASYGMLAVPSSLLRFWWPARIVNRNRKNFTVAVVFDEPDKEILKFSDATFVIPEDELDHDRLQKLSTRNNPFPSAVQAFEPVINHSDAKQYTLPPKTAYTSAIQLALKKYKEELKEQLSPKKEEKPIVAPSSSSDSELALLQGNRVQVASESDDMESDVEMGAIGLGRNKGYWWPCRVIAVNKPSNIGAQRVNSKNRQRPYQVEFYPTSKAHLSRKDLVFKDDEEFFEVPLGEIQVRGAVRLEDDQLRDILPDMAATAAGQYAGDSGRHKLFLQGGASRARLSRMGMYGAYEEAQVKQLSDFLLNWAFRRRSSSDSSTNGTLAIPPDAPFHSFTSEFDKTDYVALVLLPVALELLAINTDPTTIARAEERLKAAGIDEPSEGQLRVEAHKVVGVDLGSTTEWWEDILNLRNAQSNAMFAREQIRTELTDADLQEMGQVTRRRTNKVSYKE